MANTKSWYFSDYSDAAKNDYNWGIDRQINTWNSKPSSKQVQDWVDKSQDMKLTLHKI